METMKKFTCTIFTILFFSRRKCLLSATPAEWRNCSPKSINNRYSRADAYFEYEDLSKHSWAIISLRSNHSQMKIKDSWIQIEYQYYFDKYIFTLYILLRFHFTDIFRDCFKADGGFAVYIVFVHSKLTIRLTRISHSKYNSLVDPIPERILL